MEIKFFPPSAYNPYGYSEIAAKCDTHNKWVTFVISDMVTYCWTESEVQEVAKRFIYDGCPDCVSERAEKASRWPEGAEL